jgi:transposase InsO family protein
MGWQYQHAEWCGRLEEAGIVQSMSRKGNCIDNGATEQVFGHLKDEFFRNRVWPSFDAFKRDLDAYVVHWNTRRRQVKLKGTDPGGVPESVPEYGLVSIWPSKFWDAVQL